MGSAVGHVYPDGLNAVDGELFVGQEAQTHEKGIWQYSANIVAIMLITISLDSRQGDWSLRCYPQLCLVRRCGVHEDISGFPCNDLRVCQTISRPGDSAYGAANARCELMIGGMDNTLSCLS